MIIGQTLFKPDSTTPLPKDTYYSPWFPSGGNALTVTVDVIAIIAGGELTVTVETKNPEQDDANATTAIATTGALTVPGRTALSAGAGIGDTGNQGLLD